RHRERDAPLGPGWAFAYDTWIEEGEHVLALRDGEGRWIWFAKLAPGEATLHRRERLRLVREGSRAYRVSSLDTRLTQVFEAESGSARALLRAIRDVHGNEVRLEYEREELTRIVDTAGRELRVAWDKGRIGRVEVWAGRRLEQWVDYTYDPSGC